MNKRQRQAEAEKFFKKCLELLAKKGNDYANDADIFSNFEKISLVCDIPVGKTFLVFLTVKIARLIELLKKDNQVGESKHDSLIDIANYACLMSIFLSSSERKKK